ncbi:MAG: type II secretion system F family protein [Lachnospiraceae bacterium]|nr:type II secretion system F family protein [Lachnospiraceae bacterium]
MSTAVILIFLLILALVPALLAEDSKKPESAPDKTKLSFPPAFLTDGAAWILKKLPSGTLHSSAVIREMSETEAKLLPWSKKESFEKKNLLMAATLIYSGLLLFLGLGIILCLLPRSQGPENGVLLREDEQGESQIVELEAQVGESTEDIIVTVSPRKYNQEEAKKLLDRTQDWLNEVIIGDNESLSAVSSALYFPSEYPGEKVSITWTPSDYNLIRQDGSLASAESAGDISLPADTSVEAVISYYEYCRRISWDITIADLPSELENSLSARLERELAAADERTAEEGDLILPSEIDGEKIIWKYPAQAGLPQLAVFSVCLIAAAILLRKEQLKKEGERRALSLRLSYPGFVNRMVLMLGAGMSSARCWEKIVSDYERDEISMRRDKYLYREMKYTLMRMRSGIPEIRAYREFGERPGMEDYGRICSLLIQLIRKGGGRMEVLMAKEAEKSEEERLLTARKLGETAGTKLIFPMIILLLVVLILVMVPALLAI